MSEMITNTIYSGDCTCILEEKINKDCIDLIYADPPYNLSGKSLNLVNNQTGGAFYKMNENWDTWKYEDYLQFTDKWMKACWTVLKPSGSLYVSCTFHNLGEVLITGKKLGYKTNNVLTWYKSNAMPSITKRTFTHATEYVCWFVKGKHWIFNYNEVKMINPHRTKSGAFKQMRDYINFIELPIVQGKERLHHANGRAIHPTQKPEKLMELIIVASSKEGDIVLDPFFGTGTTGVVAARMKRKWIGIENNPEYIKEAEKRLAIIS